ncbi:hypothetical protein MKZ38_006367 [Zalerion maritima]|uniref:Uncharacterized protein n=1 Tax=Zalerion maritima TaxID=339359 RepID=A0AAD5RVM2_9PEZI|nr:hypothetical protein MKZ38_006367 [Zalerion maritima]
MAPRAVSILKFVGTVSLGLLTGLSYTLSTLTVSTLLGLPNATAASKALQSVSTSAARHLSVLRNVSGAAFLTAFILSPRAVRHPYLLYTAGFVFGSELVEYIPGCGTLLAGKPKKPSAKEGKKAATATPRGMEASYEVLGGDTSSAASEGQVEEEEEVNGEEVRGEVEGFLKAQVVQGMISGAGFLMAVVGIWGDGA